MSSATPGEGDGEGRGQTGGGDGDESPQNVNVGVANSAGNGRNWRRGIWKKAKADADSSVTTGEGPEISGGPLKALNNLGYPDDPYLEAWYELGSPIFLPFLKFLFAVTVYLVDCFFLIKNLYNAVTTERGNINPYGDPIVISLCILGLHIFTSILISIIDSLNKDAISGRKGAFHYRQHKVWLFVRTIAHLTLTMRLFRLITAYLENRRRNKQLHKLRMRRMKVSEREIQFVVDQKKNQLVESHYDLVDSFFKTVPAALLQVFFMAWTHPDAKLRLYSTIDQDRFATVFFTVITASISATNYQADYLAYKKVLLFQDSFRSGYNIPIDLTIPSEGFLISNFINQVFSIGLRMCFYSALMFWSPLQFLVALTAILGFNLCLTFVWNKTAWRFRPVLENPLYGIPWPAYDVIDLWINLFVPGVHYAKPLDHILNFYTTLISGIVVFGSFDFLTPSSHEYMGPTRLQKYNGSLTGGHNVTGHFDFGTAFEFINNSSPGTQKNYTTSEERFEDPEYFVLTVIQHLVTVHEWITFSQISYHGFFYNVVKFMNVVNFFSFLFTCVMTHIHIYEMDFPIQIVNSFYATAFAHLAQPGMGRKSQVFLVFSLLPNSAFFYRVPSLLQSTWESITPDDLGQLASYLLKKDEPHHSFCYQFWDKVGLAVAPILYPGRFREFKEILKFQDIPRDKPSIIASLAGHPLREEMISFVDSLYDGLSPDGQLLLALFCLKYNNIVRHYTSLRIKRTFQFLEIPIVKEDSFELNVRTLSGHRIKNDYELGYLKRIIREAKGRGLAETMLQMQ